MEEESVEAADLSLGKKYLVEVFSVELWVWRGSNLCVSEMDWAAAVGDKYGLLSLPLLSYEKWE